MIENKWMAKSPNVGLLLMRVAVGAVFVFSGFAKFMSIGGTTKFFASLGLAAFWVYVVAIVEILAGFAFILGAWMFTAGLILAIDMLVAIILMKSPMGLSGYRLEFILFAVSIGLALTGPGSFSLHRFLCKDCRMGNPKEI